MTKFKAGMRYEIQKLLIHSALFIAGVVWFFVVVQLVNYVIEVGSTGFGATYVFVLLFLVLWTAIAFDKDAGFFLQSGLTRREVFAIFAVTLLAGALLFTCLDAVLSLAAPGFWREQSFFLRMTGAYTATLFIVVFCFNLTVMMCTLFLTMLRRRIGTRLTVVIIIGLFLVVTAALPSLFSLVPNGLEVYGAFMTALAFYPNTPLMIPLVFYFVAVLATLALTWALMRRVRVVCFSAKR